MVSNKSSLWTFAAWTFCKCEAGLQGGISGKWKAKKGRGSLEKEEEVDSHQPPYSTDRGSINTSNSCRVFMRSWSGSSRLNGGGFWRGLITVVTNSVLKIVHCILHKVKNPKSMPKQFNLRNSAVWKCTTRCWTTNNYAGGIIPFTTSGATQNQAHLDMCLNYTRFFT